MPAPTYTDLCDVTSNWSSKAAVHRFTQPHFVSVSLLHTNTQTVLSTLWHCHDYYAFLVSLMHGVDGKPHKTKQSFWHGWHSARAFAFQLSGRDKRFIQNQLLDWDYHEGYNEKERSALTWVLYFSQARNEFWHCERTAAFSFFLQTPAGTYCKCMHTPLTGLSGFKSTFTVLFYFIFLRRKCS